MNLKSKFLVPLIFFFKCGIILSYSYKKKFDYAVVVDAGSMGSRVFIYHLTEAENGMGLDIKAKPSKNITPGLATYHENPEKSFSYLEPLVEYAKENIPQESHRQTPFFLMGTAGMRLISEDSQQKIYDSLYESFILDPSFPFKVHRSSLLTISGGMEAYYAVISTNFLANKIDPFLHPKDPENEEVLGALDLGGMSTQIIFPPLNNEGKIPYPLSSDDFWAQSHLNFGVATIRQKIWDRIVQMGGENRLQNPCAPPGHTEVHGGRVLVGSGMPKLCEKLVREVMFDNQCPASMEDDFGNAVVKVNNMCPIGGVQMPFSKGNFYAMSVFFYAMDCVRMLGPENLEHWPQPNLIEMRSAVHRFCEMELRQHKLTHDFTTVKRLPYRCVESVYILVLLSDGYGFAEEERRITFAQKVNGMEVEWTLGYLLAEVINGSAANRMAPLFSMFGEKIRKLGSGGLEIADKFAVLLGKDFEVRFLVAVAVCCFVFYQFKRKAKKA